VTREAHISSLAEARDRDFTRLVAAHYENFPVGSWLVPKDLRRHVHRIYAFARTADDIADELRDADALERFRQGFVRHCEGAAADVPLFSDLQASMREKSLPRGLFLDLLDAFAEDLVRARHDEASLLSYCRRSADPVGRLVLRVFGHADQHLDAMSDSICTGLQLLNHLQDLGEDYRERDRIYFPVEDLARFGVREPDLGAGSATPEVKALVAHWTARTAAMFAEGWPLLAAVRGRLRLELRAVLRGAAAVLRRIRAQDHDVLRRHARLSKPAQALTLLQALVDPSMPREFGRPR
jgi:squalene synthase HpnC